MIHIGCKEGFYGMILKALENILIFTYSKTLTINDKGIICLSWQYLSFTPG